MLKKLKEERDHIRTFSRVEKFFFLGAIFYGIFVSLEYAITRPVCTSMFIDAYTTTMYPYVWLATIPVNLLLVSLYGRLLHRFGILKTFLFIAGSVVCINTFSAFYLDKISWLPFVFYVWKDIYIMMMFQQLWSLVHVFVPLKKTKVVYSLFFISGGIGGMLGSFLPSFCAVQVGSQNLLYGTLPIYTIIISSFLWMMHHWDKIEHKQTLSGEEDSSSTAWSWSAFNVILRSRHLQLIAWLILFMQTAATLVDYQFNQIAELRIPDVDMRTAFFGKIVGLFNGATIFFQVCGTFFIVHFLGLKRSHLLVPSVLCVNACMFLVFPFPAVMAFSQIMLKAFDFSLFGVIREMLYVPLKREEKFHPKAVIDVFIYRSAKALASLAILALQIVAGGELLAAISWGSVALFITWILIVGFMFKHYQAAAAVN